MIRTKSVNSPIDAKRDGFRILTTRFWPQGLRNNRCHAWMPNLGPSEQLLKQGQNGKLTWFQFSQQYKAELFEKCSTDKRNKLIKNYSQKFTLRMLQSLAKCGPVTLMCYCPENQPRCHRYVLASILKRKV